jgi:tetratricopeptide (TPR) repeat protein
MSRAALVGFVLLLTSSSTWAEPTAQDRKRAGELATESATHYKRGEFEVSVALLRKAFALYPEPNLLYNLARSLEGLGDKRGAVDSYKKYLATAQRIDDRGAIERRVSLLERELGDKQPVVTTKPSPAQPSSPPLAAPLADPFAPPPEKLEPPSKLPLIPIALGAATIGAGVSFGLRARDFEQQAVEEPFALAAAEAHDNAVSNARIANVLFVTGGAVLVAGIVWEVIVLRAHGKQTDSATPRANVGARSIMLEWDLP